MSFLRSQSSLRLSRACTQIPRSSRWLSSTPQRRLGEPDPKAIPDVKAMQMTEDQASMVEVGRSPEGAVEQFHPSHQPDYTATIDHGTSKYSPVPKRVMNGSEPTEITPAAVLSGAPVDLQARTVRIYKPVRPATQSGTWGSHAWRMDWDPLPKGHRWENPLMGWQSSGDFMQGTNIKFKSKDDAISFAEKQGYEWYVQEPNERRFVPKAYANNFVHEPGPLKHIKTK
ncbi:ndufs4 NADH dehydrogenase Fe-S protein subunit [Rhinocladiella similis]